jgi:hypothetical protein
MRLAVDLHSKGILIRWRALVENLLSLSAVRRWSASEGGSEAEVAFSVAGVGSLSGGELETTGTCAQP